MPNVSTLSSMQYIGSAYVVQINFPIVNSPSYFDAVVPGTPTYDFAVIFTGQLKVSASGSYTFCITSDDGSTLSVDASLVVDNGGLHAIQTICGSITLSVGMHSVYIDYFQDQGASGVQVTYSGPDTFNNMVLVTVNTTTATACVMCTSGTYSSTSGLTLIPFHFVEYFIFFLLGLKFVLFIL